MDTPYCQKHHNTIGVATCKLCVIEELKQHRDALLIDLAASLEREDELLAVIKSHGIPVKTYSGGRPHYVKGELE